MKNNKSLISFLAASFVFLSFTYGRAEVTVTGEKNDFKTTVNSLVKGATVDIDGSGKMTMTGTPTNEFGKKLKEVIDSAHKVTIDAVKDKDRTAVGSFDKGGMQTIDLDDIGAFKAPGSMLPTKGAQIIHEIQEVFNAVKDGKPNDFTTAHRGSAKTAEDAVNQEESGITRQGESTVLPEKDGIVKVKEKYKKGDKTIDVEWKIKRTGRKFKVESVELEKAPPPRGGRLVIEQEPGIRTADTDFNSLGFMPLDNPGYLEIDSFGKVYVSEQNLDRVLVFDATIHATHGLELTPLFEISDPLLDNPQGIAVAPIQERIFVGSGNNILVFDLSGTFLTSFSDPALIEVTDLEVDRDGSLFASSFGNDLVLKFDPITGSLISTIGDPMLDGPQGLAIDQLGNLWVASFENDMILECDSDENCSVAITDSLLDGPMGLALTPQSFLVPSLLPGRVGNVAETLLVSSFLNDSALEFRLDDNSRINAAFFKTPVGIGQLVAEPIPEPSTFLLAALGQIGLIFSGGRRRTVAA